MAPGAGPPDLAESIEQNYKPLVLSLRALPLPVIAAVNGVAAGAGANLALACDLVIAARSAVFVQAFAKLGLVPDSGGTWFLPRLVGTARALGLAFLGDKLSAEQAAAWGLIWRCVEDAEFAGVVEDLARHLRRRTHPRAGAHQAGHLRGTRPRRSPRNWTSSAITRASSGAPPTTPKASPPSPPSARRVSRAAERMSDDHDGRPPRRSGWPSAPPRRCSSATAPRRRSACASRRCAAAGRRSTMRVRADMMNGHGVCHGGIVFALGDSAFAFACNSYNEATVAAAASDRFPRRGARRG